MWHFQTSVIPSDMTIDQLDRYWPALAEQREIIYTRLKNDELKTTITAGVEVSMKWTEDEIEKFHI